MKLGECVAIIEPDSVTDDFWWKAMPKVSRSMSFHPGIVPRGEFTGQCPVDRRAPGPDGALRSEQTKIQQRPRKRTAIFRRLLNGEMHVLSGVRETQQNRSGLSDK